MLPLLAALSMAAELPDDGARGALRTPVHLVRAGAVLTVGLVPFAVVAIRAESPPVSTAYTVYALAPTLVSLSGALLYRRALFDRGVDLRGPAPEIAAGMAVVGLVGAGLAIGGELGNSFDLNFTGHVLAAMGWSVSPLVSLFATPRYEKARRQATLAVLPLAVRRGSGLALHVGF